MNVLELIHSLEEAYNRFGDINISIEFHSTGIMNAPLTVLLEIKELIIESEEFIIKCE